MPSPTVQQQTKVTSRKIDSKLHLAAIVFTFLIGFVGVIVGGYVALVLSKSKTEIALWVFKINTTSAGVAIAATSLGVFGMILSRILKSYKPSSTTSSSVTNMSSHEEGAVTSVKPSTAPPASGKDGHLVDFGYNILYRHVTAHYDTSSSGTITHEIEIQSTGSHVSHYHGRYLWRNGNTDFSVKTPHKSLMFDPVIESGYRKFTIQLVEPLAKDRTEKIIMVNHWRDDAQKESPEVPMVNLTLCNSLKFIVTFAPGLNISAPQGQVRHHPGSHSAIETVGLQLNSGTLVWEPTDLRLNIAYRVFWKWS